mgnify:CR=1 FL=1
MKLLLAEDDTMLGSGMEKGLALAGFQVDWVHNGNDAVDALGHRSYDVVLLDTTFWGGLRQAHKAGTVLETFQYGASVHSSGELGIQLASMLHLGAALPNIGFYLKRKMRGEHNLLFGLTNDAFGYILTKVDFQSFERYDYISRVSLGEMTGEILIENALRMIESAE